MHEESAEADSAGQSAVAFSKTLDKGLRLLKALARHPDGLNVTELSREVKVHRTVAYRLLGTLVSHSLVSCGADGNYKLGLGVVELSRSVRPTLRTAAEKYLTLLAEKCDATAFLVAQSGTEAVVIDVAEPRNSTMHVAYRIGTRTPLIRGASGIAIVSAQPPKPGEREEITLARNQGYAVTSGELNPGAWGLAAPIRVGQSVPEASIGVVAFQPLEEKKVARMVIDAAAAVASHLV